MVELGAATMLPSLAIAAQYSNIKCFPTDLKKVMPLVQKCHEINGSPANVKPCEVYWGNQSHYDTLKEMMEGKIVDYIVCADLIYDVELSDILIDALVYLSKVN